ncbi:DUF262 domain-containing protein [Prosthecomicrobium hirschii]|uniref:DUF262 domain-containing protein n=1 Tax=Prosthecodimorpha hirschii TaxID=665126 RepID=UPI00221F87A7|nr:DUF262 domain-containing protein [Prosthecomicrobium hirschii]MCW1842008.1 DUF262 domain-containing protein [Prosthecomicrobium hirschii]
MMPSLHARELPLRKMMSEEYVFCIPNFQRAYSWSTEQAGDLLDDLFTEIDEYDPECPVDAMRPYFFGSVILVRMPNAPEADVIDGQQRLTTLTMLISLLRDIETDQATAAALHDLVHARGNPLVGTSDRFRLTLRPRDNDFFAAFVQAAGATRTVPDDHAEPAGDDNILRNLVFMRKAVEALSPKRRQRLTMFVVERCYFVVITAADRSTAYRIFSVINSRGLNLSTSDLIKAEIVSSLPDEQAEAMACEWERIEGALGRTGFESLLHHTLFAHTGRRVKSILTDFQSIVPNGIGREAFVADILIPYASIYDYLINPKVTSEWDSGSLFVLRSFDFNEWVGPALRILNNCTEQALYIEFLEKLERLCFYLLLRRDYTGSRLARFGKIVDALAAGENILQDGSPLDLNDAERQELRGLLYSPAISATRAQLPIMLRLELLLSGATSLPAPEDLHVDKFATRRAPATGRALTVGARSDKDILNGLGNLVLVRRRRSLATIRETAVERRERLMGHDANEPFATSVSLLDAEGDVTERLDQREAAFLERLCSHWRL